MATRTINVNRRDKAVDRLKVLATERDKAEAVALSSRKKLFTGVLKAFNAGMKYRELADITGMSVVRISQILVEQREKESA